MHPYVALVAAASVVCGVCGGALFVRTPQDRSSPFAATLLVGASVWAIFEIAWNLAPDAPTALQLMRLSAPTWIFIGPLMLHLFLTGLGGEIGRWDRWLLRSLYAISLAFLAATWFTPWVIGGAVQTPWGWGYQVGFAYPLFYATTMAGVIRAIGVARQIVRRSSSQAELRHRPWLAIGVAIPLVVSSVTDVVLPILGVQVPLLGTASFAMLGVLLLSTHHRFGFSILKPGGFADEILSILPDGVALLHHDERIRTANLGLIRLSGYREDRLEGMFLSELLTWSFGELPRTAHEVECELIQPGGKRIPVTASFSTLSDRQGNDIGQVLIVRDLREVAELRSRLLMSARMAAVGELAAGVAHEINNPIAFVRANLSHLQAHWKILRDSLRDDPGPLRDLALEGDEMIEESLEGVDRAAEIVRGVKNFSHAGSGAREPTDLNPLLDEVLRMAETELRGRAEVESVYAEIPTVSCTPQEIKQVFLNLVLNAGQAIDTGGSIRVETRSGDDEVIVLIEDDGTGIVAEIMDRIFDPFFTTKVVGEGTGLGLGIAYQIVKSHGGEIRVNSEPGVGTRFAVHLPAL
jgi:signal transduction histidine kinase